MLGKKKVVAPVKVETTEEIINKAVTKLSADVSSLSALKNNALSVFRSTATQLESINAKLGSKISTIEKLVEVCTTEKTNAEKIVADNEAVRKKILDIIGE